MVVGPKGVAMIKSTFKKLTGGGIENLLFLSAYPNLPVMSFQPILIAHSLAI